MEGELMILWGLAAIFLGYEHYDMCLGWHLGKAGVWSIIYVDMSRRRAWEVG
jgi:hypothetical protein